MSQTYNLCDEFNKHFSVSNYNGNTITHFHDYTVQHLNALLSMDEYKGACFDLCTARFSKRGISPILAVINGDSGITFVDSKRPAMNERLKQQMERAKEAKISCDCDLPSITNIHSLDDLIEYCDALDQDKKYRARIADCSTPYIICDIVMFIQMLRPEIKICLGSIENIIILHVHDAIAAELNKERYIKEPWYVVVDNKTFLVTASDNGVFDLGPSGKANFDMIWHKYCGVPSAFGTKEIMTELPKSATTIANAILAYTSKEKPTTLADILSGGF